MRERRCPGYYGVSHYLVDYLFIVGVGFSLAAANMAVLAVAHWQQGGTLNISQEKVGDVIVIIIYLFVRQPAIFIH